MKYEWILWLTCPFQNKGSHSIKLMQLLHLLQNCIQYPSSFSRLNSWFNKRTMKLDVEPLPTVENIFILKNGTLSSGENISRNKIISYIIDTFNYIVSTNIVPYLSIYCSSQPMINILFVSDQM